jgi:hypothetical protein
VTFDDACTFSWRDMDFGGTSSLLYVNLLNLHIIDLAKQKYTHLQRELKNKKERKNGRIIINRCE